MWPTRLLVVAVVLFVSVLQPGLSQETSAFHASDSPDQVFYWAGTPQVPDADWEKRDRRELSGTIRQFDAEQLVLELPNGQATTIDSGRVNRLVTQWRSPQAREAIGLVEARDYRGAIAKLEPAIRSGIPRWQQRLLIAKLVESVQAIDRPRTAGILFLNLADTDPPAMLYASMPLCWTVRQPDPALLEEARKWMDSQQEVAQLMGASWLLFEPQGPQAERILLELESSENDSVAQLAALQRWRLTPPPATLQKLPQWLDTRDRLIEPLQLGACEFLADRLLRVNQPDLALGQLMRIVSLAGERYDRASKALQAAQALLERQAKTPEAQRLQAWIEHSEQPEKP